MTEKSQKVSDVQFFHPDFLRAQRVKSQRRAECSSDLHRLVDAMAEVGAEASWRRMGARSVIGARGVIKSRLIRMIGINAARANATLKRERLGIALGDGVHAFARRRSAFYARTMREEYYDQAYGHGPSAC